MDIAVGVFGFICGFCAGQMLLFFMLRHKTTEEIRSDKSLRIFGVINWGIAILGAYAFVILYQKYFG